MKIEKIQRLQSLLETPKRVVIVPHSNPDGDAIGSSLGFMHFLRQNKHDAHVISPNQYPDFLKWVPGSSSLSIYEENPISCLLYTSPSPRDGLLSRMPSSA